MHLLFAACTENAVAAYTSAANSTGKLARVLDSIYRPEPQIYQTLNHWNYTISSHKMLLYIAPFPMQFTVVSHMSNVNITLKHISRKMSRQGMLNRDATILFSTAPGRRAMARKLQHIGKVLKHFIFIIKRTKQKWTDHHAAQTDLSLLSLWTTLPAIFKYLWMKSHPDSCLVAVTENGCLPISAPLPISL